jgi:hypothetical protein
MEAVVSTSSKSVCWCHILKYMYLESQRPLLQRIWHWSPPRGESLHDTAVRVQKTARSTVRQEGVARRHRDISFTSEHDLDSLDLFGDRKRTKQYVQETLDGVEIRYTLDCASYFLRLHPGLMDSTWNSSNSSRDAASLWTDSKSHGPHVLFASAQVWC